MSSCLLPIPMPSAHLGFILKWRAGYKLVKPQRTGDWYLFENYTKIWFYGVEAPRYQLPVFPARWVYALEYIWQTLKFDQLHFVPAKKGFILKLPITIGLFIVNSIHTLPIIEKLLQGMDLRQGNTWPYDPREIISNRRRRDKSTPYAHESRPFIEWRANLETWPLISQMETDSSATRERGEANRGQEEEVGSSGTSFPLRKKKKIVSSKAEIIGEE